MIARFLAWLLPIGPIAALDEMRTYYRWRILAIDQVSPVLTQIRAQLEAILRDD